MPAINPKIVIIAYAFMFAITSASLEAPNKTNDPSPSVLINAANKPPNEILLFLYREATTIVAPHPGIAPIKEPIIGCRYLGPMCGDTLLNFFLDTYVKSAKPIIDNETYPPIAPAASKLSKTNNQKLNSLFILY